MAGRRTLADRPDTARPPVLVLLNVRTAPLVRLEQVVIGWLGVLSMVAATRSDDAQAGFAFALPLLFGSAAAGLLVVVDDRLRGL
jgi:hypothetical protein